MRKKDKDKAGKNITTAAIGIASRKGLGKLRHIDVHLLWLQQQVANKEIFLYKIKGAINPADILAKYLNREDMLKHMKYLHYAAEAGRASQCPSSRS